MRPVVSNHNCSQLSLVVVAVVAPAYLPRFLLSPRWWATQLEGPGGRLMRQSSSHAVNLLSVGLVLGHRIFVLVGGRYWGGDPSERCSLNQSEVLCTLS